MRPSSPARILTPTYVLATLGFVALVWGATLRFPSTPLRVTLAALAVLVLAAPRLAGLRRLSDRLGTQLLLALALAAVAHTAGEDLRRFTTTPWVRVWNVFHYYLGAEYYAELGYNDLYDAALAADREGENYWRRIERVRNLETYETEPRAAGERRFSPTASFSPERWQRFREDVEALQPFRSPKQWRHIFTDRGYNPSPFWTAVAHRITHLLPASRPSALKLLTALDLLLMAATFVLIGRTFGLRAAAVSLLFFALTPVNAERLVGGFLQYDWFCAIAAGLCWVKTRRPIPAAAALAYASMARIFPLALVAALLAPTVFDWIRRGRSRLMRGDRFELRFGASFALFCLLAVGIGATTGRGFEAWREFSARISHHSEQHVYGEQRVGLKHLFTRDPASFALDETRGEREAHFERFKGVYRAMAVLLLVAWAAALLRRNSRDALLLGLVAVFIVTVASRYYWACLALLPLASVAGPRGRARQLWLDCGQALVYLVFFAFQLYRSEAYASYTVFNMLLLALLLAWLALWLSRDAQVLMRYLRGNQLPPRGSPEAGSSSTR